MAVVTTHPPETNSGVVTSWLPLSTVYPLRPGCSSEVWARFGVEIPADLPVVFDPGFGQLSSDWAPCQPTQVTSWWLTPTGKATGVKTLYSIGPLVCPEAYTTAGTSIIAPGSTLLACCPSAYTFVSLSAPGIIGQCTSPLISGAVVTYVQELTSGNLNGGLVSSSTTLDTDFSMVGVPINGMLFEAAVTATTISASSVSTNAMSSLSLSLPAIVSATTMPMVHSTNGLSTGAKAGIGVAVTLGGIAVLALIAFLFISRRKARRESVQEIVGSSQERGRIAQMGAEMGGSPYEESAYEMGESRQEMPVSNFQIPSPYTNPGTPYEHYAKYKHRLSIFPTLPAPVEVE